MPNRAEILKQKYHNSLGLPFAQVLSECEIQQVLADQNVRYRQVLYTPIVVLWAWISQVVDQDKSLSHAVKRVTTWLATSGKPIGRASEKSGIGSDVIPRPSFRGYLCSLSSRISCATVLPYPVEVGHDQSSNTLGRLPDFSKLILPSMPTPRLLADDAIRLFQSLGVIFSNNMYHLRWQYSLIASPIVGIPDLAIGFAFGARDKLR